MSPGDRVDDIIRLIDETLDEVSGVGAAAVERAAPAANPFGSLPAADDAGITPSV